MCREGGILLRRGLHYGFGYGGAGGNRARHRFCRFAVDDRSTVKVLHSLTRIQRFSYGRRVMLMGRRAVNPSVTKKSERYPCRQKQRRCQRQPPEQLGFTRHSTSAWYGGLIVLSSCRDCMAGSGPLQASAVSQQHRVVRQDVCTAWDSRAVARNRTQRGSGKELSRISARGANSMLDIVDSFPGTERRKHGPGCDSLIELTKGGRAKALKQFGLPH